MNVFRVSLVVGLLVFLTLSGCAGAKTPGLKVATSTSLLAYIVQQVGGDRVEVVNVVPPAQHPGDFDAKPGDIQKLADANVFLVHGWPGETYVPNLVAAASNPKLTMVTVSVDGNWMTPPVQLQAVDKVAVALSQADSKNSATYQKLAAEYKSRITAKEAEAKAKLAKASPATVNVIASGMQAPFLQWTGLNVVATYGLPESLTPKVVKELVDRGKAAQVTLVVDNLHSGRDAGKAIAEELGAKRIVLLNFPGGFANTETWEKAIDYNVEMILAAIGK